MSWVTNHLRLGAGHETTFPHAVDARVLANPRLQAVLSTDRAGDVAGSVGRRDHGLSFADVEMFDVFRSNLVDQVQAGLAGFVTLLK